VGRQGVHREPLVGLVVPRSCGLAGIEQTPRLLEDDFCHFVKVLCEAVSASVQELHGTSRLDKRGRSAKLSVRVNVSPVKGVPK
jgi:hypothetical protein